MVGDGVTHSTELTAGAELDGKAENHNSREKTTPTSDEDK